MAKTPKNNGAIEAMGSTRRVAIDQLIALQNERQAKLDRVAFLDGQIATKTKEVADVEEAITSMGGELEVWPPPPPAPPEEQAQEGEAAADA